MRPYYEQDGIEIYHGDCRDVLPGLDAAGLVLTDPPYEAEAHTQQCRVKRGGGVMVVEPLPFAPITGDRDEVACAVASRAAGWVLTFCQVEASQLWRQSYEAGGLTYRRTCIWVKPDGMPQYSGDRPGMGYETFVAMHAPGKSEWNGGGAHGCYTFNKGEHGGTPNAHPTQKPLRLIVRLVNDFSDVNDSVLDPFMGSGTTLVAAKNLGRKAIGIEIEEKYCEIAAERLSQQVLAL